jgi:hypothetical protein
MNRLCQSRDMSKLVRLLFTLEEIDMRFNKNILTTNICC